MARKRIIDPEFWLDEDIALCNFASRLFYIGTWNFSDDYGVIEDSVPKLKAQIFPYDDIDVKPLREKMLALKKLVPFEAQGKRWLYVRNFLKYQRVDKPSKNRNPEPPQSVFSESSASTPLPLNDEVKLREVKLSKVKRREAAASPEELKSLFTRNPLWETISKEFPDRNYDLQFALMCDWWLQNKKHLPKQISAWSNWLVKSKPDEKLLGKRMAEIAAAKNSEMIEIALQTPKVSNETLATLRDQMKKIGRKI